ncbi:MAG: DUF4097 domain-containing protein [Solirubrobacterales bacterium]|nr:DUF4097 domain-containing protein [Solirubrobacterales bacterium]
MATPTPYRTSRPVRLLLFGAGGVLAVLMVLWGTAHALDRLSIQEERTVTAYRDVERIDLRHAHGNVTLVGSDGPEVRVEVDSRHGFLAGHERTAAVAAGELRLRGACDFLTFGTCEDHYRIEVPAGVAVTVRTSAGEATAVGLRGDLELRSSAGPVRARDVRGDTVVLRSGAGPVSADRVRAERLELRSNAGDVRVVRSAATTVYARTSAGPVDVELLRPPRSLEARSSAGPVTAVVPDVGYDVDADTAAGPEEVLVRQVPGAARTIVAGSNAGPVTVRPLPRGEALNAPRARPRSGERARSPRPARARADAPRSRR